MSGAEGGEESYDSRQHSSAPTFPSAKLAILATALYSGETMSQRVSDVHSNFELYRRAALLLPGLPSQYDVHYYGPVEPHRAKSVTEKGATFETAAKIELFLNETRYLCLCHRDTKIHYVVKLEMLDATDPRISQWSLTWMDFLTAAARCLSKCFSFKKQPVAAQQVKRIDDDSSRQSTASESDREQLLSTS